ncbi:S26 family signal peptidase [Sphingomonadaceae bacterium G21617-S1]|nr:S26 family signal peptidase [Sphingomonadaceae bacterium G21617-S1]
MKRAPVAPRPVPLLDWGKVEAPASPKPKGKRKPAPRRAFAMAGIGVGLLVSTIAVNPAPRLIWNASASAPIGLYSNAPSAPVARGDMVIARVPEHLRALASERGYIPAKVPLVKRVGAVAGDTVCAFGQEILLNGAQAGERLLVDGQGRDLPQWHGCARLRDGQYFLMMPGNAASFDGRYFGLSDAADIVGRASALWTR